MGDAAKTFAVLCYTLPGFPLIYSGQESAFNHRLEFFDKDNIVWGNYSLGKFYTTLNRMKAGFIVNDILLELALSWRDEAQGKSPENEELKQSA